MAKLRTFDKILEPESMHLLILWGGKVLFQVFYILEAADFCVWDVNILHCYGYFEEMPLRIQRNGKYVGERVVWEIFPDVRNTINKL